MESKKKKKGSEEPMGRIMFDHISGHHGPAKLTQKINHHSITPPKSRNVSIIHLYLCLAILIKLAPSGIATKQALSSCQCFTHIVSNSNSPFKAFLGSPFSMHLHNKS